MFLLLGLILPMFSHAPHTTQNIMILSPDRHFSKVFQCVLLLGFILQLFPHGFGTRPSLIKVFQWFLLLGFIIRMFFRGFGAWASPAPVQNIMDVLPNLHSAQVFQWFSLPCFMLTRFSMFLCSGLYFLLSNNDSLACLANRGSPLGS